MLAQTFMEDLKRSLQISMRSALRLMPVFNMLFVADKQQQKAAARRVLPAGQRQRYVTQSKTEKK